MGHTDGVRLWLNGSLVAESDRTAWWTPENIIMDPVVFHRGRNRLAIKALRGTGSLRLSLTFHGFAGLT